MPNNFAVLDQHDFTAGELDPQSKRGNDDPLVKAGARQLLNARILNTKGAANRPGRNLVAARASQSRDEDILMAPGVTYRLSFTNATLKIFDSTGTQVFTEGGRAWTGATLGQIIFAIYLNQIFLTFPGVVPEVLTWDGVTTWSSAAFAELLVGSQVRTPFYRLAAKGIGLSVGGGTGSIGLVTTDPYFVAGAAPVGMVNTLIRFIGRQIRIDSVTNATTATGTVLEPLPGTQNINFGPLNPNLVFSISDVVIGSVSGAKGVVLNVGGGAINVQLLTLGTTVETINGSPQTEAFVTSDTIVSAGGALPATTVGPVGAPANSFEWDEELMNSYRGFPRSVAVDQGRLIFSDFPALPGAIAWSAFGTPIDLNVGANPTDGFLEIAPGKNRVQHVVPGPESSEIVFCDNGIFYISISATNPLKPGSVTFQKISSDGAGAVQPRAVGEVIVYADQGLTQLASIVAVGAYNRPFVTVSLTDLHSHLFNNIQAIALPTSVTQFPERYAYVLNGDGTLAVGKYTLDETGKLAGKIGWVPWNGFGVGKWVSALNDVVTFVTAYTQGAATAFMVEQLDATRYLDASLPINAIPAALTPPGGKGPLWWLPLATVDLMDGAFALGPHATDANGFIVPTQPGEDLSSATLRAGFMWTGVIEPFLPPVQGGQDGGQRMKKRRCARFEVYVANSSGFAVRQIYTGQQGPNLPVPGTYMGGRRIPAYNQDDNTNIAPPLREQAYTTRPRGRAHDPRVAIVKDTPGPLTIVEISARVSV